jgi:urease accessory protein
MTSFVTRAAATTAALLSLTAVASAHTGQGDAHGFVHGFMHPVGGLDHVLAMVAVGLYASLLGGRALLLVPASFVGVMAIGGAIGIAGIGLPYVEIGIALSIVVLGLAVALRLSIPTLAAMALVGVFAIFHGHAHGGEMPQDASGYSYAAGFMLATALLHAAGVAIGLIAGRLTALGGSRLTQTAGGAMALAGVVILVRAI